MKAEADKIVSTFFLKENQGKSKAELIELITPILEQINTDAFHRGSQAVWRHIDSLKRKFM